MHLYFIVHIHNYGIKLMQITAKNGSMVLDFYPIKGWDDNIIPDEFLRKVTADLGVELPSLGSYGVGNIFLPKECAASLVFFSNTHAPVWDTSKILSKTQTSPSQKKFLH